MLVAKMERVRKHYPTMSRPAVDDLFLEVPAGSINVIVGANGSGKTTTMEILSGLRTADSGSVTICGREVVPGGRHRLHVGVQVQDAGLPQRMRVRDAVRAVAVLYDDPGPVDEILEALGLTSRTDDMVDRLSGGWQRRLDIALACIGRPRLLVLDEPSSGLDPTARAELWQFLRQLRADGVGVLASTHDLTEAEAFADRLHVLQDGRVLLSGSVDEVLACAGGSWRLRLLDADTRTDAAVRALGSTPLRVGEHISVIGTRAPLERLATALEGRRTQGELLYRDQVSGPVRLEDVFAYAAAEGELHHGVAR